MSAQSNPLIDIFSLHERTRFQSMIDRNINFSHYTSCDAAIQIIRNRTMWMRNASLMNDYSEIKYGEQFLFDCWKEKELGGRLQSILDTIDGSIKSKISERIIRYKTSRIEETYILSISEHDISEQKYGRLSMWRAYGGDNGVALILNKYKIAEIIKSGLIVFPVLYADIDDFKNFFHQFVSNVENKIEVISSIPHGYIINYIWNYFQYIIMSTKHPGFREEREWRIIYSPKIYHATAVCKINAIVSGVDQELYELRIPNAISLTTKHAMDRFIDKIIIGPGVTPEDTYRKLHEEIARIHPRNISEKIIQSDIPLRR